MKKTTLLSILVFGAACYWSCSRGAAAEEVSRIGYLSSRDRDSDSARSEAVRQGLRERGYIEGQNIAIEYRFAEGKPSGSPNSRLSWCASKSISSWQQEAPSWSGES
jgi:hypothetical protein